MTTIAHQIRKSLSLRLSLSILSMVAVIFIATIGFLFYRSRTAVKQIAIDQTTQMLENTAHHVMEVLNEVEEATNNTDWIVLKNLEPDTILALSRQILEVNPSLNGCSIAFEPFFFKSQGKYFSAYSSNDNGHIETEQEGSDDYYYFNMDWYSVPMKLHKACWIDPFKDYNPGGFYARDMIASYCKPLVTADGRAIGVISTDLSQRRLSQLLIRDQQYLHSYYLLLGKKGQIIASGSDKATADDLESSDHMVLKEEIADTGWTLAIICQKDDIFNGYYQLAYIVISIVIIGLLLMLLFCYVIVRRTTAPVSVLATQVSSMTNGRFDVPMERSSRYDEIGQLQNSFASMQQSIASYVSNLEQVKAETKQRNKELLQAKNQAEEADRKKLLFIQDVSHQIRTPLNIINGFAQVLHGGQGMLKEDEVVVMTHDIQQNTNTIATILDNFVQTLELEDAHQVECHDDVNCCELCHQLAQNMTLRNPASVMLCENMKVPDNLKVVTNRKYLTKILEELLHNANKYTIQGTISIGCEQQDDQSVSFMVSDTGPGIPAADEERIFTQFTKLNNFNEGLGMGLTLCRHLAELLGGSLTLDKKYREGARFVVTLPL